MIGHFIALIKRELWEHRSIFVTPIVIGSVVTLGTLTALVFVGEFQQELNLAIFGAQNVAGDTERKAVLTGLFIGSSWLFLLGLGVLTVFYALDSLYAERKDKSILFWRSLPVTDAETVISKLLTALVVIPAIAMLGYWIVLQFIGGLSSLGASGGGVAFWAHVGGFVGGAILVWLFKDEELLLNHPYHGWNQPVDPADVWKDPRNRQ